MTKAVLDQENFIDDLGDDGKSDDEGNLAESRSGEDTMSHTNSSGDMLAEKETRIVNYLRQGVLLFLFLSAGAIAFAVHHFTTAMEQNEFKQAVNNYANKAVEELQANTERQLMALDSFATYMTTSAKTANATWPFFVVPNFSPLVRSTLSEVQALKMDTLPVVMERERAEWNMFALANHADWEKADLVFQAIGGYDKAFADSFGQAESKGNGGDTRTLKEGEDLKETELVDTSTGIGSDIFVVITKNDGTRVAIPDRRDRKSVV